MFYASVFIGVCFAVLTCQALVLTDLERTQYEPMFKAFIKTHSKVYQNDDEHEHRFGIFVENMKRAKELQKRQLGTATYGVTKFSDLTAAEFKTQYGTLNAKLNSEVNLKKAKIPNVKLPTNFDWRKKNVVTEVKNQGNCGSCWSFSTTGNIEGLWAIKHKKLISLSEQELVDCDTLNNGCHGGLMTKAYKTIKRLGGLEREKDYPYNATKRTCSFKKSKVVVKISGGVSLPSNENKMAQWLYKMGPVSIGLDSSDMAFYTGGISRPNSTDCNVSNVDHGVLLVGFGKSGGIPYWIVKNSWGTDWGEDGYYRIHRGSSACGLNSMPSSALL